jgi:transketolase
MNSYELAWKIRRHCVEMAHISRGAHIGSSLSVADIIAVLYNEIMTIFPNEPKNDLRDRFILSKGHAGAAVYAVLAEKGFFGIDVLNTYNADGSLLSGHVSHINVPGVEFSTGSLGHGISIACGMALAAKRDGKNHRVFVLVGDGECNEGSVWEAALFANHFNLSNLTLIVDHNKLQSLDTCENTLELLNLANKWQTFGWRVVETDGHDHVSLINTLNKPGNQKPLCVIAHTIKGKGISFMENQVLWHYRDPQGDDYINAVNELTATKP